MKIAIIGRPNVGKSTLFNRLVGKKLAIVGDISGITRDRKSANAELFGLKFDILDTPGVDTFSKDSLAESMNEQSFAALKESDVIFFVVDAIEGVTEYDKSIASWIRSSFKKTENRPVILIKNKSDGKSRLENEPVLGFGDGVAISAEHNLGMDELYSRLSKHSIETTKDTKNLEEDHHLKAAIIGRPNVGKSTLINAIIGDERLLTGAQAGITRDAISVDWKFKNQKISIIDTAGQRKKSKVNDKIEDIAVLDAWRYIRQANVVVIVMDIQNPLEKQDVTIARKVFDEGKIIIFALNKSDTVKDAEEILKSVERRLEKEFAQLPRAPCLLVSAKEKLGLARIFNVSFKLFDLWSKRISTSILNRWLESAIAQNPPPLVNGFPIKLKYISQTNTKPPTFIAFANKSIPASYERYLLNRMRESFDLYGIPLRLFLRKPRFLKE